MAKAPTFNTITAAFASASKLNANNALTVTAFDNTISRDGSSPNTMTADFDMNSNDILNVSALNADIITLGGTLMSPSAVAAADTHDLDTRGTVAAVNISSGFNFVRTSGFTSVGDGGAALYKRITPEPSHNLKITSLDGAFWELVPDHGYVNVKQAGAKGDNTTNDGQAFIDALSFASLNADVNNNSTYGVIVPPSDTPYYLGANTLELKRSVHLVGQVSAQNQAPPCELRWDVNITGIIVHTNTTIGAGVEVLGGAGNLSGAGSTIEGLSLLSDGGTIANITDDTKGHGIWLRARAVLTDLRIFDFPGNGVNIVASAGGADDVEGNANNWHIERLVSGGNSKSGLFVNGADVNAGMMIGSDLFNNGRWGVFDSSFLGNTYVGCHTSGNGLATVGENGAGQSSFVHLSGTRYGANVAASEADLVATTPGTDEAVWYDMGSGSVHATVPTWLSSQSTGTYFHGGPYHSDNANARNVFTGNYSETGQGPSQWVTPTTVFGGFINSFRGTAVVHVDSRVHGTIEFNPAVAGSVPLKFITSSSSTHFCDFLVTGDHAKGWNIGYDSGIGQIIFQHANLTAREPLHLTTDLNTEKYGRDAALSGGDIVCEKGIFLGAGGSARRVSNATAAATTGDRARGEYDLNKNAASGDPAGWLCTTAHASTPTFTALYGVGTKQSTIVDAVVAHNINSTFSDTEVEATLDALGVKINSLIAVLDHFGFTATS